MVAAKKSMSKGRGRVSFRRLRGASAIILASIVSLFLLGAVCVAPAFAMTGDGSLKRSAEGNGDGGDDRRVRPTAGGELPDLSVNLLADPDAGVADPQQQQLAEDAHGLQQQLQAAEAAAFTDLFDSPSPPSAKTSVEMRRRQQEERHQQLAQALQQQQAHRQQVAAQMQVSAQSPAVSPEVTALAAMLAQVVSAPGGSGTSAAAAAAATAAQTNSTAVPSMEALLSAIYTVSPTGLGVGALSCAAPGGAAVERARGVLQQFFAAIAAAVPAPVLAPAPPAGPSSGPAYAVSASLPAYAVPSAAVCTLALVVMS
jgi:hypothetical protein